MKKLTKISLIFVFFILLIGGFSKVFGAENIDIKITPNNTNLTTSDVMLIIDISSTKLFNSSSSQGVQILVGEESVSNKWVDLGIGKNGIALKRSYNYIVKTNSKISVRVASWNNEDRTDLQVLATQTYNVSNIDKTNPVIEKIDVDTTTNSISLNIVAKDSESGINKYTCICEELSYNKSGETPKFDINGLEENKEYSFVITVEDKLGNKTSNTKKVKTKAKEGVNVNNTVQQNAISVEQNIAQINTQDNTIANKKIPDVGTRDFIIVFIISVILIISIILIINKR